MAKQRRMKKTHDECVRQRVFSQGDTVFAKNFGPGPKWVPATIEANTGPVSCTVSLGGGQLQRRHYDHIRVRRAQHSAPSASCSVSGEVRDSGEVREMMSFR